MPKKKIKLWKGAVVRKNGLWIGVGGLVLLFVEKDYKEVKNCNYR